MLYVLRHCLLLLLMLTLPMQGVSAALLSVQMQQAHRADASVQARAQADACHHGYTLSASDDGSRQAPHDGHPLPAKAKTCAGCCGSLAAGFELSSRLAPRPDQNYLAAELPTPEGVIPAGPERPPRRLS